MQIDLTQIISALILLMVAIITKIVIPYIKGKTTADQYSKLAFWAKLAVEAAEKLFKESGMGASKKEYVKSFLEQKGFELDETEIDVVIESAVLEMQEAISSTAS